MQAMKVEAQEARTDERGVAHFKDMPIGVYYVDVAFSKDFGSATKKIQLGLEKEQKIFVGLKPRSEIFVELSFLSALTQERLDHTKLEAKLVSIPESNCEDITHLDLDEEDYYIYYGKGTWYSYVKPGHYLLHVACKGYLEVSQGLNITSATRTFTVTCEPQS